MAWNLIKGYVFMA